MREALPAPAVAAPAVPIGERPLTLQEVWASDFGYGARCSQRACTPNISSHGCLEANALDREAKDHEEGSL